MCRNVLMYRYVYMQYKCIECGSVWFDRLYQEFLTLNGTLHACILHTHTHTNTI